MACVSSPPGMGRTTSPPGLGGVGGGRIAPKGECPPGAKLGGESTHPAAPRRTPWTKATLLRPPQNVRPALSKVRSKRGCLHEQGILVENCSRRETAGEGNCADTPLAMVMSYSGSSRCIQHGIIWSSHRPRVAGAKHSISCSHNRCAGQGLVSRGS